MARSVRAGFVLLASTLPACSAEWHVERGQEALDRSDLAAAEAHFRRALERDPDRPDALAGLGWTYEVAGKVSAAAQVFERCARVARDDVECVRGEASVAMAQGNPVRARRLLRKALKLAPDDPRVQSTVALLDLATGDVDRAADRYAELVRRYPKRGEYALGLAEARLRQGEVDEALAIVKKALMRSETPLRYRAMLYQLRARALLAASAGRLDPKNCAESAAPVLAWVDAAQAAVDAARASGVNLPDLPVVERRVQRRRSALLEACPGAVSEKSSQPGSGS